MNKITFAFAWIIIISGIAVIGTMPSFFPDYAKIIFALILLVFGLVITYKLFD